MFAPNRPMLIVVALAVVGSVVGVPAVAASSHGSDTVGTQSSAHLRVVHASPDAPAVDVSVDDQPVLSNVSFGAVSDYLSVAAGNHTVTIAANETGDVVFEDTLTLGARTVTTVAASGEVSEDAETEFAPVALNDNAYTPAENESAVRLVHLSPDAPAVDVTVPPAEGSNGTLVLADNLSFGESTGYMAVPAGDYEVQIRADTPENDGDVVTTVNVTLASETAYSAMAVGYLNPDDAPADTPFEVVTSEDATRTLHLPGMAAGMAADDENATESPDEPRTPAPPPE